MIKNTTSITQFIYQLNRIHAFFFLILYGGAAFAAAPNVNSQTPIINSLTAPTNVDVVVNFDEPIKAASVTTSSFIVTGSLSGLHKDTPSVSGSQITLNPNKDFKPGETVTVTLTTDIQNDADSTPMVAPNTWQFVVKAAIAPGNFIDSGQILGSSDSYGVALGDVDNDGDLDAFVVNNAQANLVWLNDGSGTFTDSGQSLGTSKSRGVALGDVDGDGDLDAFVVNNAQANRVWLNDGLGIFSSGWELKLGSSTSRRVALGDVDGDGDLDAFVANNNKANRVWLNNGGTFTDSGLGYEVDGLNASYGGVILGDIDGDYDLDAFVVNAIKAGVNQPNRVWLNDGDSSGQFTNTQALGSSSSGGIALGDINGNGKLDAFVANNGANLVWQNDGSGTFVDTTQSLGSLISADIKLGDLDGDGDLDAFVTNWDGKANYVWLNNAGTFTDSNQNLGDSNSTNVALGDVDGDGDLDAFIANKGQGNRVWLNKITLPTAQTDLAATTVSKNQINLSWNDNSDNEVGFKVERAGSLITTTAANAISYSDSGLSCGTTYSYSVKATNAAGDSSAATINVRTSSCPPPTYKLTVSKTGNGIINGTGINCGSDCQQYIVINTNITLTATSDDGWLFSTWGEDCDTNGQVLINTHKTCTATFVEITCTDTNRLYVNQTASGKKIGCDWENAFTDLQKALAEISAGTFSGVKEIWVTKGTYKPTNSTNRGATFQLLNGVSIYGGFAGNETQLSERNHSSANTTILSGDIGIAGDNSDNSYHVVTGSGTNNTAFMDGFSISGGNANDGNICPNACGGGLFNDDGSPTLKHLFIKDNTAVLGGGVMNWHDSQPIIKESFINENNATDGGGIVNDGSHPVISHVFVKDNIATNIGGGMLNQNQANPLLSHVNLSGNSALTGGGMANDNSNPVISHSVLSANTATDGGGMVNSNQSAPTLSHVVLHGNTATQSGGAILNDNSTPLITQSTLSGNSSGIVNRNSRLTVNNSILWNNSTAIIDDANSQTTVNYSIVKGGWAGDGNKTDDPLFVEVINEVTIRTTVGNFHLADDSPAIDAGNNDLIPLDLADAECKGGVIGDGNITEPVDIDFDGRERRFDGNGDGIDTVDMGAYEALPSISLHSLTVTITGEGSGAVNSDKIGITCGTDCDQEYPNGMKVFLFAKPEIGSQFARWSGACQGNEANVLVEMTEAKNCGAKFDRARFSLDGITLICEDCTINNAALETVAAQPVAPGDYSFPQGLVSFELGEIVNPQAHLSIYYHYINSLDNFFYRKYGPTTPGDPNSANWYNFSNVTIGLDILDNQTMLKASLILADGEFGDYTVVDGRIVDTGGIARAIVTTTPSTVISTTPLCTMSDRDIINISCNAGGKTFTKEVKVKENSSISNAIFESDVDNKGIISNSTVGPNAILIGGKLSGSIINDGSIADVNFVGIELRGGTLSGTITNNSKVGGIIKDVHLAAGAILKGGKVGGTIAGDPNDPPLITAARIMPGSILANVRLSPTVELPKDVVLGEGVILPSEPPTLADFGLEPADIAKLNVKTLVNLYLSIFAAFTAEDVAKIPPAAFAGIKSAQIGVIQKEALFGMTMEQFEHMPVNTLSGLTAENMGGLPTEVIAELTPKHLDALNVKAFKAMPSEDISKLFTHLDANKITPQYVEKLLPETWEIDLKTGALTQPVGTKATLQSLPLQLPSNVALPTIPNLGAGFGIGGGGTPLIEEAQSSLVEFVLSQDKNGILRVENIEDKDILYTFIPDTDNVIQVNTDKIPVGLAVGANGFYDITPPNGLQFKVIPAPKDPVVLSQSLGGGEIVIGKRGDVMVELSNKTRRRGARQVVIMDPFIEPTLDELLCREIIPGVVICDEEMMPPSKRLLREKSDQPNKVVYKVVYPDNTAQTVRPTLLSPDVFIEKARKFKGVQEVVYNADGTFYVLYRDKIYTIVPNFNITSREASTDEKIDPSIVLNDNGSLTYTIAIDVVEEVELEEEENRRFGRRGRARSVLIFDPFIEPAPEDLLCREIFPGNTVCDFEIKDALIR